MHIRASLAVDRAEAFGLKNLLTGFAEADPGSG
jgi:hypothetical protein